MTTKQTLINFDMQPNADAERAIPVMQESDLASPFHSNGGWQFCGAILLLVMNLRNVLVADMTLEYQLAGRFRSKEIEKLVDMHNGRQRSWWLSGTPVIEGGGKLQQFVENRFGLRHITQPGQDARPFDLRGANALLLQVANRADPLLRACLG